MNSLFTPTWMIDRFSDIDPESLRKQGIKAIFSDLDNTLVIWNEPKGTEELQQWLSTLKNDHFPLIIVSNNNAARVGKAVASLDLPFMARALKPLSFGITRARHKLGLKRSEVVMLGDQLLTDICAANRAGVRSILVKPLTDTDKWDTRINRAIERPVMKKMLANNPGLRWEKEIK